MAKTTKPTGAQFIASTRWERPPTFQERRLDTIPRARTEHIQLPGFTPRRAITAGRLLD